jgi:UDP-3-O-[3-hydroxymyristoyl] N-acetylglucosamine deacetylase
MHLSAYTLTTPVEQAGIGLHSGQETLVRLLPRATAGIEITINGQPLPLHPAHVRPTPLCTTLAAGNVTLSTPEHLFAALHGLGVFAVKIEVTGAPEIPILDGSAQPWVALIDAAGRTPLATMPLPLKVRRPLTYRQAERVLSATPPPDGELTIACTIDFPHPLIGRQSWAGVMNEDIFRSQIAPARSFALQAEVEAAQAAGLLRGATLASGVLFMADGTVANPEGLRFPDEPVRHKVLDFLGDSFLTGRSLIGQFTLVATGHSANNQLLQQLLAQSEER